MFTENSDSEYSERLQDLISFVDFMYRISREMSFKETLERSSAELSFKVIENMYFMSKRFLARITSDSNKNLSFVELSEE